MNVFVYVLTHNILPIMLVASFGYLLHRRLSLQIGALSSVVFNILSPCLVFASLANSQLPGDELVRLVAFSAINILVMGGLAFVLARLLNLQRAEKASLLIVAMFVNGGNYGLTLLQLRYGEDGLSRGVVYYVTSTVMVYTVGVIIASMGNVSWRATLQRMVRLPAVYAAILAIIVYGFSIHIPQPIMSGITIAGNGTSRSCCSYWGCKLRPFILTTRAAMYGRPSACVCWVGRWWESRWRSFWVCKARPAARW